MELFVVLVPFWAGEGGGGGGKTETAATGFKMQTSAYMQSVKL
jgi:hypothetical protein